MKSNDMTESKKQQKKLYVFAHRGEAQAWLDQVHFIKIPFIFDGLWESDHSFLLICDEGLQNTTEKLSIFLAQFNHVVSEIFNYGIVGKLSQNLEYEKIYPIRYVYHYANNEAQYKSFHISNHGVDCISAYERINLKSKAEELSNFAQVVDRELWAICRVAQIFKKNVKAFKLVSDDSGFSQKIECQLIQENALQFSLQFYLYDQQFINDVQKTEIPKIQIPEKYLQLFYFTRSMEQQFQSISKKLKQKLNVSSDTWLEENIQHLVTEKMHPKERALLLLEKMNERLNPFHSQLKSQLKQLISPFEDKNISIQFAKDHENTDLNIYFKVSSVENLNSQIENLRNLPIQKIQSILNGDLHV